MSSSVLYPGLSAPMSAAVEAVMSGRRPDPNTFHVYLTQYWHRLPIVAGGTFTSSQNFFTAPTQAGVTNFFGSAGLPQDQAAVAVGASIRLQSGTVYTTGNASAVPNNSGPAAPAAVSATEPAALVTAVRLAEAMSWLHANGTIRLSIGNRDVIDNVYGVESFPFPGGINLDAVLATFAGTFTSGQAAASTLTNINNGIPQAGNFFPFSPRQVVLPGKPMTGNIQYTGTPPTLTGLDITARFVVHAIAIRPANA